ncbi:hypothetical protein SAMN03159391_03952 [Pseudomonas sp. NFACC37-1]|nr:hypothetical protein SAMN03159391_03952 [Pseudomonas sp. NFACC37-1]
MPGWRSAIVLNRDRDARTKCQKAIKPEIFSTKDTTPCREIFSASHPSCVHRSSNVGAGLLAKAVGQLASMLNGPPSSRASSLPQWDLGRAQVLDSLEIQCGSELARDSGESVYTRAPGRSATMPSWSFAKAATRTSTGRLDGGGDPADAGSGRAVDRIQRDRQSPLRLMAHTRRLFSGQ